MKTERTFSRETWIEAMAAWEAGGYGPEWADWRLLAAKAGIIFPPDGTAEDSWGDDSPSQRAMVIRAIRETPTLLRAAIEAPGVRSWFDVLARLLGDLGEMAAGVRRAEAEWTREKGRPAEPIASVIGTLRDSIPTDTEPCERTDCFPGDRRHGHVDGPTGRWTWVIEPWV